MKFSRIRDEIIPDPQHCWKQAKKAFITSCVAELYHFGGAEAVMRRGCGPDYSYKDV
jgi:hypothetical protein